jgi:RNA-directed DNA polymerase
MLSIGMKILFLGFTFKAGRILWHSKTLLKFKQRIRLLTNRNWALSNAYLKSQELYALRDGWIKLYYSQ